MSSPKAWCERLDESWLGQPSVRSLVDEKVREQIAGLRRLGQSERAGVAAFSITDLYSDLLVMGERGMWLWCTTAIALCGEFIFAAERGGVFSREVEERWKRYAAFIDIRALRILRNAACHPAHQVADGSGEPPVLQLVAHINRSELEEAPLAERLLAARSDLNLRSVSEFALRKLDAAGRTFCQEYKIPIDGPRHTKRGR